MITITIKRNVKNEIIAFKMEGHAGYAKEGNDIVCSAVSALANMILIGFNELNVEPKYEIKDSGFLSIEVPEGIVEDKNKKLQFLLECMIQEIMDIKGNYGKYIKIIQETA